MRPVMIGQYMVRQVFPEATREQVEAAYAAHKAVIQASWRQQCISDMTGQARWLMLKDLDRMVTACKPFSPEDWYLRVQQNLAQVTHDIQFDGAWGDLNIECGIIQTCHDFIKEAAVVLGILDEMTAKYEVRVW
jgi:hypothetical protein